MENKKRILAYQLATEIDLKALSSIAGAASSSTNWHATYAITGGQNGPVSFDVSVDLGD